MSNWFSQTPASHPSSNPAQSTLNPASVTPSSPTTALGSSLSKSKSSQDILRDARRKAGMDEATGNPLNASGGSAIGTKRTAEAFDPVKNVKRRNLGSPQKAPNALASSTNTNDLSTPERFGTNSLYGKNDRSRSPNTPTHIRSPHHLTRSRLSRSTLPTTLSQSRSDDFAAGGGGSPQQDPMGREDDDGPPLKSYFDEDVVGGGAFVGSGSGRGSGLNGAEENTNYKSFFTQPSFTFQYPSQSSSQIQQSQSQSQPQLQAQPPAPTLQIYGPPHSLLDQLHSLLARFGTVQSFEKGPIDSNWVKVTFADPSVALRVLNQSGEIWVGNICCGVRVLNGDNSIIRMSAFQAQQPASQNQIDGIPISNNSNQLVTQNQSQSQPSISGLPSTSNSFSTPQRPQSAPTTSSSTSATTSSLFRTIVPQSSPNSGFRPTTPKASTTNANTPKRNTIPNEYSFGMNINPDQAQVGHNVGVGSGAANSTGAAGRASWFGLTSKIGEVLFGR